MYTHTYFYVSVYSGLNLILSLVEVFAVNLTYKQVIPWSFSSH